MAYCTWIGYQVHSDGFGYVTDFGFMLVWPAIFAFLGWLIFVLPLLAFPITCVYFSRPKIAWLFWLISSVISYFLLVIAWFGSSMMAFIWFPCLIGIISGLFFPFFVSSKIDWKLQAASPFIVITLFIFVLWPTAEEVIPYYTYKYGSQSAKDRSVRNIFTYIKKGDDYSILSKKYPMIFTEDSTGFSASSSGPSETFRYGISVDENKKVSDVYYD